MASIAKEVLRATLGAPMMVPIIELSNGDDKIIPKFHTDKLNEILDKNPSLKRYMVIDISGKMRTGKSFLANLLICQLRHLKENPADRLANWLKCDDKVSGVEWKYGESSVTEGVHMWNEPFVLGQGESEFGVLMMDCQGMGDYKDGRSEIADVLLDYWVLRLSTVHIFNVSKYINKTDFTHLADILYYCKLKAKTSTSMTGFNSMLVVHRDWPEIEKCGPADGFFRHQKTDKRCTTLQDQLALIEKHFKSCRQFMLPEPSGTTRRASNGSDEHKISGFLDIKDQRFLQYVAKLGQLLFLQLPSTERWVFTDVSELKKNMLDMKELYANGASILKTGSSLDGMAWEEIQGHVNHIRTEFVPKDASTIHPATDSEDDIRSKVQECLNNARNYMKQREKELDINRPDLWVLALVEVDRMYTDMETEKPKLNAVYGKIEKGGKDVGKVVGVAAVAAAVVVAGVAAGVAAGVSAGAAAGAGGAAGVMLLLRRLMLPVRLAGSVAIAGAGAQLGSSVGGYITKAITKSLENDTNK